MKLNVLSVFDGISAGRLALDRAGFEVGIYHRSEIDKYATAVAMQHYPHDVQLGDVTKWREWGLDWSSIDLFIGGSPCQGFSFAGKQAGTKATLNGDEILVTDRETYLDLKSKGAEFLSQSHLFWEYVLILDHIKTHNPNVKFMLENVKMKKELLKMIDEALGVESVVINSSLVSAQNRHRHYWCNWNVTQPEDKGILLRDVLEDHAPSEFNLSDAAIDYMGRLRNGKPRWEYHKNPTNGKAACLTANMHKGVPYGVLQLPRGKNNGGIHTEKSPTLTSNSWEQNHRVLVNESATKSGKAYTLTASQGNCVAWNSIERKQRTMVPVCESDSVEPNVYNGILYRKLTPIECERLQTFPDDYTAAIEKCSYSLYNCEETDKKEDLHLCDVKLMVAKGKQEQKSKVTCALCTTSDLLDMGLLSYQRLISVKMQSVNIVIEKLEKKEVEPEGCVVDITKTGLDMETLCMQIKSSLNLGQQVTKNALVVKTSTGKLLRIISAESCQEMRLFTILIAIKLITQLRICMYVKDRANINYCIDSLKELQGNLLGVVLSSLRMETTEQTVSNTQRYKSLGNSWTVDVIAHIFGCLKDELTAKNS